MEYPSQIRKLSKGDGGGYLVTYPDLPGCMSDGDTVEEAIKNGETAVKDWIKARKKLGREIPDPTPPIDLEDYSGKFVQRVPKSVHAALAKRAELEDVSMNQLVLTYLAAGLAGTGRTFSTKTTKVAARKTPAKSVPAKYIRGVALSREKSSVRKRTTKK